MQNPSSATICPACGGSNQCALASDPSAQQCWCMQSSSHLPLPDSNTASCYCPACLQKILRKQQELRLLT